MAIIHCTLKFHRFKMVELNPFANGVNNGVYGNPTVFLNPPITQNDFTVLQDAYAVALADYNTYGKTKRSSYTASRKSLIAALDVMASYVTECAQGDASMIILAGYTPSGSSQQRNAPVERVDHFILKRGETGIITVEIPPILNRGSIHYFCICSEGKELAPDFYDNGVLKTGSTDHAIYYNFTKPRIKTFRGLTPIIEYYFYVFVANATSVSPLSDARKMMAV